MASKLVTCFESLELPKDSNSNSSGNNTARADFARVYPTAKHIFITHSNVLVAKALKTAEDEQLDLPIEPISCIQKHPTPITCVGISDNGWLVCACSEMEVVLSKWDSMLKTFDSNKIGVNLGRINSCAVTIKENCVYTALARFNELMVLHCKPASTIEDVGPLDFVSLEMLARLDKTNDTCTWLQVVWFQDALHLIGISSGNSVSVKIWEITADNQIRLKDHRMTSQSKTFSSADLTPEDEHYLLIVISPDGLAEVMTVTSDGFGLVSRVKLDESAFTPSILIPVKDANTTGIQIEFKILAVCYFRFHPAEKVAEAVESSEEPEIPDLNNTLSWNGKPAWEYPKLLVAVASTKGLSLFNVRSGESEFCTTFLDILNGSVVSNAKLCMDTTGSNQLSCVVQPLFNKSIYAFRIALKPNSQMSAEDISWSLTSVTPAPSKSVLHKKLKSPRPQPPPKKNPNFSSLSLHPQKFRVPLEAGPAWSLNGATNPKRTENPKSKMLDKTKAKSASESGCNTSRPCASGEPGSQGIISCRIQNRGNYRDGADLIFPENQRFAIQTRLSETMTYLRMTFSHDGKILAAGGTDSPLVIYKTVSILENLKIHKDSRKITAIDFPVCSNSTNLLLASTNGKTEIINWKTGNEILSFKFTSKFTEHVHSQFYYMDTFILQPEDKMLSLYSFRGNLHLKAGSFPLNFQKITAIAAPNKFYSSAILCAGSNKSIQLFDAASEKVSLTIPNGHTKSIFAIRLNETPKASQATSLCDIFLTAANSVTDPIKLWDLRSARCITRIADLNVKAFVPNSRPALSPCGRYIASGFEENTIVLYDIRKINSRVNTLKGLQTQILDLDFDKHSPMLWAGSRNGKLWNFNTQ